MPPGCARAAFSALPSTPRWGNVESYLKLEQCDLPPLRTRAVLNERQLDSPPKRARAGCTIGGRHRHWSVESEEPCSTKLLLLGEWPSQAVTADAALVRSRCSLASDTSPANDCSRTHFNHEKRKELKRCAQGTVAVPTHASAPQQTSNPLRVSASDSRYGRSSYAPMHQGDVRTRRSKRPLQTSSPLLSAWITSLTPSALN